VHLVLGDPKMFRTYRCEEQNTKTGQVVLKLLKLSENKFIEWWERGIRNGFGPDWKYPDLESVLEITIAISKTNF